LIILNEKEYIEAIISGKPVENIYYTLTLLARYYTQLGYKKGNIYKELENFLVKQKEDVLDWQESLDKIIEKRNKELIEIDAVPITEKELETIKQIKNRRLEKISFTILCLAKFNNMVHEKNNNWVNREIKDIFKLADIRDNSNKQCLSINDIKNLGLVKYSHKIDNVNLCVTFIDNESEVVLKVDDFRDLGFQYLAYLGEDYIKCEGCGKPVKKSGNKMKYCDECANEKHKEIDRNYQQNKYKSKILDK